DPRCFPPGGGRQGAPPGQAARQGPEDLVGLGVDAELVQRLQVLRQLLLRRGLHGGGGHELGRDLGALLGRRGGRRLGSQAFQEEGEPAQAEGHRRREVAGRGGPRGPGRRVTAPLAVDYADRSGGRGGGRGG